MNQNAVMEDTVKENTARKGAARKSTARKNTERWVRDLCWAVNSPALLGESRRLKQHEIASILNWRIEPEDIDQDHLHSFLSPRISKRTGKYFEWLVVYWIQHIRRCEIVGHSLQIVDQKQTIGEIDLLFRDEQGRLNHWELAVKFYLQVKRKGELGVDYVGPNSNDTLRRKFERLVEHQLTLSRHTYPEVEIRQVFVKGRIYYPWLTEKTNRDHQYDSVVDESLSLLASDHLRGYWLRRSDAETVLIEEEIHCDFAQKPYWLAPEDARETGIKTLSPNESMAYLTNHFADYQGPVLLTAYRLKAGKDPRTMSIFVVPDHWPRTGTEFSN